MYLKAGQHANLKTGQSMRTKVNRWMLGRADSCATTVDGAPVTRGTTRQCHAATIWRMNMILQTQEEHPRLWASMATLLLRVGETQKTSMSRALWRLNANQVMEFGTTLIRTL